jgi:hypothetical protein
MISSYFEMFKQKISACTEFEIKCNIDLFKGMNAEAFQEIVLKIHDYDTEDHFLRQQFVYYLTLLRKDSHIKALINESEIPIDIIESLILSAHARDILEDEITEDKLDRILSLFRQEDYLRLLTESTYLSRDTFLALYILTKLDNKHLDIYFTEHERLYEVIRKLEELSDDMIKNFFIKNSDLYGYVSLIVETEDIDSVKLKQLVSNFDMERYQQLKSIIFDIQRNFDVKSEMSLPMSERDSRRFAMIVQHVKDSSDLVYLLHSFQEEGVIGEDEKNLIMEIIKNPMFSDVLEKYSEFNPDELDNSGSVLF